MILHALWLVCREALFLCSFVKNIQKTFLFLVNLYIAFVSLL